jgi:hypothetical protein
LEGEFQVGLVPYLERPRVYLSGDVGEDARALDMGFDPHQICPFTVIGGHALQRQVDSTDIGQVEGRGPVLSTCAMTFLVTKKGTYHFMLGWSNAMLSCAGALDCSS